MVTRWRLAMGLIAVAATATACSSGNGGKATGSIPSSTATSAAAPTSPTSSTVTVSTVASAASCKSPQLRLSLDRFVGSAMNQPAAYFELINTSSSVCTLRAYPRLILYDRAGGRIGTATVNGGAYLLKDPGAHVVRVQPGRIAYFGVGWGRQPAQAQSASSCVDIARVRVLVPGTSQWLTAAAPLNDAPFCPPSASVTAIAARAAFTISKP